VTTSRQNGHIEQEDLALYAMQLLSEAEAAAISEHLRGCTVCQEEVAALQGDLTALAMTSEMQSPPAAAKQRLFQQIGRGKKVVPVAPVANSEREAVGARELESVRRGGAADARRGGTVPVIRDGSNLDGAEEWRAAPRAGRVMPWVGWAVAAGALVAVGSLYRQMQEMRGSLIAESVKVASLSEEAERGRALVDALTDQSATRVTLTPTPEAPRPVGRATYVPDKGTLLFTANNLDPLPPYKTYELWLIPANGHDPIPAGTFQPDARGNASVILPELPKGVIAKAFGVTIEDAGGSQQPTLPILLVGAPT
jgi:hypothetical protein